MTCKKTGIPGEPWWVFLSLRSLSDKNPVFRTTFIYRVARTYSPTAYAPAHNGESLDVGYIFLNLIECTCMLYLHFAPSLDMLVTDLLRQLRMVWTDPFVAPEILVPNPALGKWLRMQLADGGGKNVEDAPPFRCIANLKLSAIEQYLWKLLRPGDHVLLDQHRLQQVLCALLDEACIRRDEFAPVRSYLTTAKEIDSSKRVQLAGRIAHQFLEYEYNRPGFWRKEGRWEPQGIDGTWMKGTSYIPDNPDERWQAALYRTMRQYIAAGTRNDGAGSFLTLPQLYRKRREAVIPVDAPFPVHPATVFMFGVTKISHFHRNFLVEISQVDHFDLHVYLTNPCAEFWEDVNTSRTVWRRSWNHSSDHAGIRPRQRDDYNREELSGIAGIQETADHRLLELWGNAGKENIFLWCQDAQWNFDYTYPEWIDQEKKPATLLESLQCSLLLRKMELVPPAGGVNDDASLRILACPDRGREIEEIREQVLDLVRDHEISMLNEVVVYLTDPSSYLPYIQRVFGRFTPYDPGYLPFSILGTAGKDTLFGQGIRALLDLFKPRFDRAHVFELLRNPIVQASRGFSAYDVALWEQWADALSIFRGYDIEQRSAMGDTGLTLTDAHTFRLGMTRMLIAELAEGATTLDFFEHDMEGESITVKQLPVIPWRDFTTSDRNSLDTFCATVEALYLDGKQLHGSIAATIDTAVETMRDLVVRWMGTIPETSAVDGAVEGRMLRSLCDNLSAISLQKCIAARKHIPYEEFAMLCIGCLPEEGVSTAHAWTGGITFAPLRPSLVIPHTVVFVAGLDDVLFPGSNERPSWDMLSSRRIIGDSDRVRDNRFAFLELLHAARKRLILSYRSQDMQKECELHPSSIIEELRVFLSTATPVGNDSTGKPVSPLFRELPWIVHESLDAIAAWGRTYGTWNRIDIDLARLSHGKREKHRYDLDDTKMVASRPGAGIRITLRDLCIFFRNPLEYHLTRTLGIDYDDAPATMYATDEPLDSDRFSLLTIRRNVWISVLRKIFPEDSATVIPDDGALENLAIEEAARLYGRHVASGGGPEAMPEKMELCSMMKWAKACVASTRSLRETFTDHHLVENGDLALGRNNMAGTMELKTGNEDPWGTAGEPTGAAIDCTVECRHNLLLLPRKAGQPGIVGILALKVTGTLIDNPDLWIEGVLQWLAEKRHPAGTPELMLVQMNFQTFLIERYRCGGNDQDYVVVRKWLLSIIHEIAGHCSDHLPFRVIKKVTGRHLKSPPPWETGLARITKKVLEDELSGEHGYTSFSPAFALVDARVPDLSDEELRRRVDARYRPVLEGRLIASKDTV